MTLDLSFSGPDAPERVVVDFETQAIEPHPNYPPAPVGVSVKLGPHTVYLSWGHPTGNNTTFLEAAEFLWDIWFLKLPFVFHNAKFDLEVARVYFGLPTPDRVEDTLYLVYLADPQADTLALKPVSARILGMPPDEQETVRDWLIGHGVVPMNTKNWGAYISKAPGDVVGPYANGDVMRTDRLLTHLSGTIRDKGMEAAYERELALMPVLVRNEAEGIRVDLDKLESDTAHFEREWLGLDYAIKMELKCGDINLDSAVQIADAIEAAGKGKFTMLTPTGKRSTSAEAMAVAVHDKDLLALIQYRAGMKTILGTFMRKWLIQAKANGGRLRPSWNQVRGDYGGTRTGRLSCYEPNLQNVPKEMENITPLGYPPLPHMRQYILADPGQVFVSADFHSQEVRILGHFAGGKVAEIYQNDPAADVHQIAANIIREESGIETDRKQTKVIAFSILYGAGVRRIADQLGCSVSDAANLKAAYLNALTGVKDFMWEVEDRAAAKEPVRTWGGRLLYAPPTVIKDTGAVWNRDYALVNYLIQGSAADQTKQAIVDYERERKHGRFLLTVHDEICISVPKKHLQTEVEILTRVMAAGKFDLPMRATVSVGPNWTNMKDYKYEANKG